MKLMKSIVSSLNSNSKISLNFVEVD